MLTFSSNTYSWNHIYDLIQVQHNFSGIFGYKLFPEYGHFFEIGSVNLVNTLEIKQRLVSNYGKGKQFQWRDRINCIDHTVQLVVM